MVHKSDNVADSPSASEATPQERRRARKLQIFLDGAFDIIEAKGLDGLTIQALADRTEYSVGALYRYFPSKQALLAALQTQAVNDLGHELEKQLQRVCVCGCGRLATQCSRALAGPLIVAETLLEWIRKRRVYFGLLTLSLGDPRRLLEGDDALQVFRTAVPVVGRMAAVFDQAEVDGAFVPGNGTDRAMILWMALTGILQLEKMADRWVGFLDTRRQAEQLVFDLFHGWGADRREMIETIRFLNLAFAHAPSLARAESSGL